MSSNRDPNNYLIAQLCKLPSPCWANQRGSTKMSEDRSDASKILRIPAGHNCQCILFRANRSPRYRRVDVPDALDFEASSILARVGRRDGTHVDHDAFRSQCARSALFKENRGHAMPIRQHYDNELRVLADFLQ